MAGVLTHTSKLKRVELLRQAAAELRLVPEPVAASALARIFEGAAVIARYCDNEIPNQKQVEVAVRHWEVSEDWKMYTTGMGLSPAEAKRRIRKGRKLSKYTVDDWLKKKKK